VKIESDSAEHTVEAGADFRALETPIAEPPILPEAETLAWAEATSPAAAAAARATGLYVWRDPITLSDLTREELRLDVDGPFPLMIASGTVRAYSARVHWIASLTQTGPDSWSGAVWYRDGSTVIFPYTNVQISVTRNWFRSLRSATVTFAAAGAPARIRTYRFWSRSFRYVNFEFDAAEGESALLRIDTGDHPNRPPTLPDESISIQTVFRRAGFDVITSPAGTVPIGDAGEDAVWTDQEMHDAMQSYWGRFGARAQWALWVFFASLHELGETLGGIMFDDIGPNHRQGTAIFNDSFISSPPANDPAPDAWVRRMIFWTACHEMGHGFNLAHSWNKSAGTTWIPLADELEARSFMNYPYRVAGGQSAFFRDFEYRFSEHELLFMRHAPERFVQMGNAAWFDDHAFEYANISPEPALALELRANRDMPLFEFLEPVILELKLTNVSGEPQLADERILSTGDAATVVIKRDRRAAREFHPFAQRCTQPQNRALAPGESMYEPLRIFAGLNGWDIAEPGNYLVQVSIRLRSGEDVVSNELRVRVAPPRTYEEELVAAEVLTEDVGRAMALDGSRVLNRANDTLREVVQSLPDRRVALHAAVALATPLTREYKELVAEDGVPKVEVRPPQPDPARALLHEAFERAAPAAVESFGHIDFRRKVERTVGWLIDEGDQEAAVQLQNVLVETLESREVNGRPIVASAVDEVRKERDRLARQSKPKRSKNQRSS